MMLNISIRDVLQSTFTNAAECRREETGMVTRVRIETEGRSTDEVENTLHAISESVTRTAFDAAVVSHQLAPCTRAGELVIERFAKDLGGDAGHGAIFYRGRMTTHYAERYKTLSLGDRNLNTAPSGPPPSVGYNPETGHATVTTAS